MNQFTRPLYWKSFIFRGDSYLPTPVVNFYESVQCFSILVPWTGQEHLQSVQNLLGDEIQKMNFILEDETALHSGFTFPTSVEQKLFSVAQNVNQSIFKTWNSEKFQCCIEMMLFQWKPDYLAWMNMSSLQIHAFSKTSCEILSTPNYLESSKIKHSLPRLFLGEGSVQVYSTGCVRFPNWNSVHFFQGTSVQTSLNMISAGHSFHDFQKIIELNSPQPFWIGSLSQDASIQGDVVGSIQK